MQWFLRKWHGVNSEFERSAQTQWKSKVLKCCTVVRGGAAHCSAVMVWVSSESQSYAMLCYATLCCCMLLLRILLCLLLLLRRQLVQLLLRLADAKCVIRSSQSVFPHSHHSSAISLTPPLCLHLRIFCKDIPFLITPFKSFLYEINWVIVLVLIIRYKILFSLLSPKKHLIFLKKIYIILFLIRQNY